MAHSLTVCSVDIHQLAAIVKNHIDNALILDSRSFLEYNASHVVNAVNVGCAKLMKRRLQQEKLCIEDFLAQNCHWDVDTSIDIIVYDQNTQDAKYLPPDSFMAVFLQKLLPVYNSVNILRGGFLEFQAAYPNLCEDERTKYAPLTSLSQPCLPVSNHGPTRILPYLYLGSQHDALNKEMLQHHNITYQLNVTTSCPKPDFIQESHFMRIPVIDNYSEKLSPYFPAAFQFLDKVKECSGCVLVHCLAGISRSATFAIAYIMKSMKMTSDEAYRYVKAKRATISPNFNFLGQLLEYEKQLQKEYILDLTSEPVSAPPFNTSSLSYERTFRQSSVPCDPAGKETWSQKLFPGSYTLKYADVAEIKTYRGRTLRYGANECTTQEQSVIKKLSSYACIPEEVPVSFKCLPVSSLKELNFTPCQTSVRLSGKEENKSKCDTQTQISPTKSPTFNLCKRADKKPDSLYIAMPFGADFKPESAQTVKLISPGFSPMPFGADFKPESAQTVKLISPGFSPMPFGADFKPESAQTVKLISPGFSPASDTRAFEFDTKSYNRSDSVSTSGIGSEGSDYADSWNEFTSSCERESDILMDDDCAAVPPGDSELRRNKFGFEDSYDEALSLYSKYEHRYHSFHTPHEVTEDYSQAVPNYQAKKFNAKWDESYKCSDSNHTVLLPTLHDELGKSHLLYRAQSCPVMLSSTEVGTSTESSDLQNHGHVKLRKPKSDNSSKDKYKNRFSCSSIDYMDYSHHTGLSRESCPDALHLSIGSQRSKIPHSNYRHSLIQVS